MPVQLNFPSSAPVLGFSTTIEGQVLFFKFKWVGRTDTWYLDITTQDGEPLVLAAKLVPNTPLMRRNRQLGPEGNFYVFKKPASPRVTAGRYDTGVNKGFQIHYYTQDELIELIGTTE